MRKLWIAALLPLLIGCPPPVLRPATPVTLAEAIARVNANSAHITTCFKATGPVRGHVTDDAGIRRPFDLQASVQVLAPSYLYASFKSGLGTEEMMLGSNADAYWLYVNRDNRTYRVGTYTAERADPTDPLPLRPDLIVEALGWVALPGITVGTQGPVHRVVDDYQQLLFLDYTAKGQAVIEKEYWLDRRAPHLIRRMLFRDPQGRVLMDSRLDAYRTVGSSGLLLPTRIRIAWPRDGSALDFHVRRWKPLPDRDKDNAAFIPPHRRGQRFDNMIDLDTGLPIQ